ncbi:unnamed protein product [Danaus chrysippus]|uniref:(African queen) hypothetical protein n=1 Tax=Danaus chrysippus TaxID=151541 RepID=A0A8J2W8G3_9NEOP|nr:unnamed protein product [Danaus chrysippus]
MVVLEGGGALLEPALALDGATAACLERAYAQADVSLKLLPKRYINLHQWLSPVSTSVTAAAAAGKDLKLQIRPKSVHATLIVTLSGAWGGCSAPLWAAGTGRGHGPPSTPHHTTPQHNTPPTFEMQIVTPNAANLTPYLPCTQHPTQLL